MLYMYFIIVILICNYVLYVHFYSIILQYEDFPEPSNDENLLRKILLLTIGNFYEWSIDHMNMYYI